MHCVEQQYCIISIYVDWANIYEITNITIAKNNYKFKSTSYECICRLFLKNITTIKLIDDSTIPFYPIHTYNDIFKVKNEDLQVIKYIFTFEMNIHILPIYFYI
jgi:hypothetical protein